MYINIIPISILSFIYEVKIQLIFLNLMGPLNLGCITDPQGSGGLSMILACAKMFREIVLVFRVSFANPSPLPSKFTIFPNL